MIRFLGISLLFNLFAITAMAQNSSVKGTVKDGVDKTPVQGATVVIFLKGDSTKSKVGTAVTDSKGSFELSDIGTGNYNVEISSVGYEKVNKAIVTTGATEDLGTINFIKRGKELEGVTVVAQAPPVIVKDDTTQFSANQFKVNPDATTEDLIKKMPGITVAKDGTVTAQGETIKKVTVDGKDFFGDDASAALKNLPSMVVDKIQVYDRLSDQAQLTGFDDGNSVKAINIVTKSGIKNGQFGRVYAGYGTNDRYSGGGNISFFNGSRRLSFIGNFNNINQQNFGSQDLLGLTSGGGGGGRGGGPGGGGNSNNFSVGQSSGINKTNAIGINYSDQWGKKVVITGSYFFNNSSNINQSLSNTETFSTPKNQYSKQNSNALAQNNNHRINLRLEYKLDSSNSIFIIPSINFQNNNSSSLTSTQNYFGPNDSLNTSLNNSRADRLGYNIRNSILFRHSFKKRGRTLSFGFNTTYSKNDGESYTDAQYRFFNDAIITDSVQNQFYDNTSNGHTISANIAYTEPIGKKGQLQINYTPSVQKNSADQQTYSFDGVKYSKFDSILSNKFDNTITTNNAGLSYRLGRTRDEQLSLGVNFQTSLLESQRVFPSATSIHQTFENILPNAMWRKKLSSTSNIRLFYRASTNFPSINQLQDVVSYSDPLRVSSGNPDLKQSYANLLSGRYSYVNSKTSKSFFANIFLQTASNYITNATYIPYDADSLIQQKLVLKKGSQLTKPVNLDGYKSLSTFFTYSVPVKVVKTTINLNAGFSYSRLPGLINITNTITNNYVYNTGVVFASNISEFVDFDINYNASFNNAQTTNTRSSNNNYISQTVGIQMNLLDKKGWFINNDVSNQSYSGLSGGLNTSYWLWNAAIGKKFLKRQAGELKLSVFDLLKQNQSIVRTVTGAYIQDTQSQVLQQYFMLTFSYSLKNFGTPAKNTNERFDQNRGGMMGPGGGRGPGPGGMGPSF